MRVFAVVSSGQRGMKAVRWVGKCVNEVDAVWKPQWQKRERREKRQKEKIKKDMWAWRAAQGQPFHLATGEEKAKNTLQLFFHQGREWGGKRECKIGRLKKQEIYPLHQQLLLLLLLLEAVLPSLRFFILFLSTETRAGNCVIHVGYSTLLGSVGV